MSQPSESVQIFICSQSGFWTLLHKKFRIYGPITCVFQFLHLCDHDGTNGLKFFGFKPHYGSNQHFSVKFYTFSQRKSDSLILIYFFSFFLFIYFILISFAQQSFEILGRFQIDASDSNWLKFQKWRFELSARLPTSIWKTFWEEHRVLKRLVYLLVVSDTFLY